MSVVLFVLFMGALIRWRSNRPLIFAFVYYFLSIFFILRFDDKVDFTVVSDRFMYLPCLGFCIWLGVELERRLKPNKLVIPFIIIFIFFWGLRTFQQSQIWYNSLTLWNDVVRRYPQSYEAYYGRGMSYGFIWQYDLALADFSKAIDLNPVDVNAYNMRGKTYFYLGKYKEALEDINTVIKFNPSYLGAYLTRAAIEEKVHDFSRAADDYIYVQRMSGKSFAGSLNELQKESLQFSVRRR